jgi:hypothetical protein
MDPETVEATLSRLRSECELCGQWSRFTGRTEMRDGRTYAILRCPTDGGEFPVWSQAGEPLLAAYERARGGLINPGAYQRAFAILTRTDETAVRALLAAPPADLPLFSVEDVSVPRDLAGRWCELLLDWDGWRPRPARSVRVEEALATAVRFNDPGCVERVRARAALAEIDAVLERLERRFHHVDPSVLLPFARPAPARSDAALLRAMAERLCAVAKGNADEIRRALSMPLEPPPLGASEVLVTAGVLSVAAVELRWSPPRFTRAQLDGVFGQGQALPRTGPGASHEIAYAVAVAGSPAKLTVFASFARHPAPEVAAKNVVLRIDPA